MIGEIVHGVRFADFRSQNHACFARSAVADGRPIAVVAAREDGDAARDYLEIIGARDAELDLLGELNDLEFLGSSDYRGVVPLVFVRATRPNLHDLFFRHPEVALFCDHLYRPTETHESPELFTVGTRGEIARELASTNTRAVSDSVSRRRAAARARFGPGYVDDALLASAMASADVKSVEIHCLGPHGTNIARAAGIFAKTAAAPRKVKLVVHPRAVEPREYAQLAARAAGPGRLPLHVECAVFYDLERLYRERQNEVVFAGHSYMALDSMQLAARCRRGTLAQNPGDLRLASHPSPRALGDRLLQAGATYVRSSSNADAAHRVAEGEADLCVTTESARQATGLELVHRFGAPVMLFTYGTPLGVEELRGYADRPRSRPSLRERNSLLDRTL